MTASEMGQHPLDAGYFADESGTERRGPRPPSVWPLLPGPTPANHRLAVIDIDSDERQGNAQRAGAMVYNTTRRMRIARGRAVVEEGTYRELPGPRRRSGVETALLGAAQFLRLYRPRRPQTNWDVFFDPSLLQFDQLNAQAPERVDALERSGWRIVFLTSLPDSCFEVRRQQLVEAGLLSQHDVSRGLICKPELAQFLRTDHWKALVLGGLVYHHYLDLTEKGYRLLPDLVIHFPWMVGGLIGHYQPSQVLALDDEEKNAAQFRAVARAIEIERGKGQVQVTGGSDLRAAEDYCTTSAQPGG